jgi:hypothetical protein
MCLRVSTGIFGHSESQIAAVCVCVLWLSNHGMNFIKFQFFISTKSVFVQRNDMFLCALKDMKRSVRDADTNSLSTREGRWVLQERGYNGRPKTA